MDWERELSSMHMGNVLLTSAQYRLLLCLHLEPLRTRPSNGRCTVKLRSGGCKCEYFISVTHLLKLTSAGDYHR
jgi:hypothetical protein